MVPGASTAGFPPHGLLALERKDADGTWREAWRLEAR